MRSLSSALVLAVVATVAPLALAQINPANLAISNYTLVSQAPYSQTWAYYTYTAAMTNTGTALGPITATVTSRTSSIVIVAGQGNLQFPASGHNSQVFATNGFTVLVDRTVNFDFNYLTWSFNAPVANAGPGQTVAVDTTVHLTAAASSNPSGLGTLSYNWTFTSLPSGSSATITNPTSLTPTFVPDVVGNYVVSVAVSNGSGTDSASVTISTNQTGAVANAGPNQTVAQGTTVHLSGSLSSDVDGDPLTYSWTMVQTPPGSQAALSGSKTVNPTFVADQLGNYLVQLVVNDGFANTPPTFVTITTVPYTAPVANAGPSQLVAVGASVQLNGSNSTDVDGNPITYQWTLITVPTGSAAVLSNSAIVNPTFTADLKGTYIAQLIVNDGISNSKASMVTITTSTTLPPTANAGPNQTVTPGATVTLAGSGTDPQSLPLTYSWAILSKPTGSGATLSNPAIANPTFVVDFPGTYVAQLIVNDGVLSSIPSTVTISTGNTPPVANPGVGQTVAVGTTVTLNGSASSDSDHDPLTYKWSILSTPSGSTATLQFPTTVSPTFVADLAGTFVVQLIVADGTVNSNPATVTVTAVPPLTVTITSLPNGAVNEVYTPTQITVNGGTSPYTYAVTGLPAGLTVSSGGLITGMPGTAGTSNVQVTVTDSSSPAHLSASASLSIRINASLSITTIALPSGSAGVAYTPFTVTATGGTGSGYSFSSTTLPAGLTISTGGVISGTPATAGTSSVTLKVMDSSASSASTTLSMTIGNSAVSITTTSLSNGAVGTPYSTPALTATGGSGTYTWSATGLPSGLTMSAGGSITGTPGAAGTSQVSITVKDTSTPQESATANFSITINNAGLAVATTSLANGTAGTAYSATVNATGGSGVYTWSATGLPSGLTISSGGVITGTPGSAGSSQVAITVKDTSTPQMTATANLSLTINNPALMITTTSLANGTKGTAYSANLNATGGSGSYTWSATGLPAGLTVTGGSITGTPSTAGTSAVTITVKDTSTPQMTANATLSLTINNPALAITTTSLSNGTAGTAYSASLAASGGSGSYSWSATGLPTGLTISTGGSISGTPAAAGTSQVSITVKDTSTPQMTANATLSLTINNPALAISTSSLANGTVGTAYTASLAATGGSSSYTWSATGLPTGLTISAGGSITGTPGTAGTSQVSITVKDTSTPQMTATASLSLTINNPGLAVSTTSLANGTVGTAYTASLGATGGSGTYSWSATGLPSGLTISAGGSITGTPATAGTSQVSITVKDTSTPQMTATASLSLTINNPVLAVSTTSLANGTVGTAYTASLGATGGSGTYSWSATGLPSGLTISAGGSITGTPATAGTSAVTITVKDTSTPQMTAMANLSLTINNSALMLTTTSLANGTVGTAYSVTLNATGGSGAGTYTWSATGLPSGLTISAGGSITGTPNTAGTSQVSITVKDTSTPQMTANAMLSLKINPATLTATAPTSVPTGVTQTAYTTNAPTPTGGTTPYTWSATGLPAGLTITASSGVISGTPTTAGTSAVTLKVTDSTTPTAMTATANVTITVEAPVTVTTTSLTAGTAGTAYSFGPVTATGGVGPYTFSATGLPTGLTMSTGGVISGTPSTAGTSQVSITATDSTSPTHLTGTASLSLLINSATQSLGAIALQTNANVPAGYSGTIGVTLSLPAPAGGTTVTLVSSNTSVLKVVGSVFIAQGATTPSTAAQITGVVNGSATITGSSTGYTSDTETVQVSTALQFASTSVTMAANTSQSLTLNLTGQAPQNPVPVTLTVDNPGLLNFSPTATIPQGQNSTTITVFAGSVGGTINITASTTTTGILSSTMKVIVVGGVSISTPSPLPSGTVGATYNTTVAGSGGTAPYTFSATGLPAGLTISTAGVISGVPTTAGTSAVLVTIKDSSTPSQLTATSSLSLTIAPGVLITTTSLPTGGAGSAYTPTTVTAINGTKPYTFSAAGLPAGLTISSGGVITGTPASAGSSTVMITVTDSSSPILTTTANLSINIVSALSVTTTTLTNGTVQTAYNATVAATGGSGSYTWTASGLPANLTISSGGVITGSPTTAGTSQVTITVTDTTTQLTKSATLPLTIDSQLAFTTTSLPQGTSGNPYTSGQINVTGGLTPYSFTATGLPTGLTISAGGIITGTPASAGTSQVTVTVTDSTTPALTKQTTLSLTINAGLAIGATSLPTGTANVAYSFGPSGFNVTGGIAPYTYSATGLPAGLTISTAGAITGSPSTAGTSTVMLTVTDSSNPVLTKTASLPITINGALAITPITLPSGTVNIAYVATKVNATGGTSPYTWSATGLPAGLTISSTSGIISGTPSTAGTGNVNVTVTDSSNQTLNSSLSLPITINASLGITTTSPLATGVVSNPYPAVTVQATGGVKPYTWSATGLPSGLTISSTSGIISGTPATAGTSVATVTVTDSTPGTALNAQANLSITINPAFQITTTSPIAAGTASIPYTFTVVATGGTTPYTWSATGLPSGLTISTAGVISGTPGTAGTSSVSVSVTDSSNPTINKMATLSLTINPGVTVTTSSLPTGAVNTLYSSGQLLATGGSGSYTWSQSGLPAGLNISTGGVISGTPSTAGTSNVTITATDTANSALHASATLQLKINASLVATAPTSVPTGVIQTAYTTSQPGATGGTSPYTWSASTLPAGLTVSTAGVISGTPTTAGTTAVTLTVKDSSTPQLSATANITITIEGTLSVTSTALPSGDALSAYLAPALTATGGSGTGTYTWSATGLPSGLTISIGGVISGTPAAAGTSSVQVTVKDNSTPQLSANATLSLNINAQLLITTTSLPASAAGANAYSFTMASSGGTANYTWTASNLPAGLTINAAGVISGTPTTAGTSSPTITVTDSSSPAASKSATLSLTINPALTFTTSSLPSAVANSSYSTSVVATGGTSPLTYSATGLPSGLSMSTGGAITGTPATAGTSSVVVTVTDSSNSTPAYTKQVTLPLTINSALTITTTSLPTSEVSATYSFQANATGGLAPLTFSATSLPAGLTISSSGLITGTPSTAGTNSPVITVTDSTTPTHATKSATLSLLINPTLAITTTTLTNSEVGATYSFQVATTGGTAPLTFSATGLPAGLTISSAGLITGNPTTAGTSAPVITVVDSSNGPVTKNATLSMTVNTALALNTSTPPTGASGFSYTATPVTGTGGTTPYTYTASGLPAGLTISSTSGVISGTPSSGGTSNVMVTVADSAQPTPVSKQASVTITISTGMTITTATLPSGSVNIAYTPTTIQYVGGVQPITFSATGLPGGLTISSSGGVITGTPTATGTFSSVVVKLTDSSSPTPVTTTKTLSITIVPQLVITNSPTLPSGTAGVQYVGAQLVATGGTSGYTYSAIGLPSGLAISATGAITGTPTTFGTALPFTAVVMDSSNPPITATLAMNITIAIGSTPVMNMSNVTVGQNLQAQANVNLSQATSIPLAAGGTTFTFTVSNPSAALVSIGPGTPVLPGTATMTAQVDAGTTTLPVYVGALASSGTVTITVSAPGYGTTTSTATLTPSAFVISGGNGYGGSIQVAQGTFPTITVTAVQTDQFGNPVTPQELIFPIITGYNPQNGSPIEGPNTLNVALSVANSTYGSVSPAFAQFTSGGLTSVTTTFIAGTTAGTTTITAVEPTASSVQAFWATGFGTPAANANILPVTIEALSVTPHNVTVGANLEATTYVSLQGAVPQQPPSTGCSLGCVPMVVTSSDPTKFLLSTTPTGAGSSQITVNITSLQIRSPNFYVYGVANTGTYPYTASVQGYTTASGNITLTQSGFTITNGATGGPYSFSTTTSSLPTSIDVNPAQLDGSGNYVTEGVLAGGVTATLTLSSSNSVVGSVAPTTYTITQGTSQGAQSSLFTPLSTGTATISVATPSGYSTPTSQTSFVATVSAAHFTLAGNGSTVGNNLQVAEDIILGASAPTGGLAVSLTATGNLLLSTSGIDAGATHITLNIAAGASSAVYYVYGLASSGSGTITATAPNFISNGGITINLAPSGLIIGTVLQGVGGPMNTTVATGPTNFIVAATLLTTDGTNSVTSYNTQGVAGFLTSGVTVSLTDSSSATGTVPATVTIASGPITQSNPSAGTVTAAFTPVAIGGANISIAAQPSGFTTPNWSISALEGGVPTSSPTIMIVNVPN